MYAQQQAGLLIDCVFVIRDARAVCSADFAQHGARFSHDVRHAEGSANFHQFTARDDDLAAFSQRVQGQHDRRRAIIDDHGANAAHAFLVEQAGEQALYMDIALAALAGGNVKFKIGVLGPQLH